MARNAAAESQREKITLFNEQKRSESQVQRLSSEVQRANQAMDKMRAEAVSMRSKLADLRDERSSLQRQLETAEAEGKSALEQRESGVGWFGTVRAHYPRRADPTSAPLH